MSGHVLEDLRILDQWAKQTVMSIKVSWQNYQYFTSKREIIKVFAPSA